MSPVHVRSPMDPNHRTPLSTTAITSALTIPNGTFHPGTKVQVGALKVVVDRYLSEGGFAHVYVVRLPSPINGESTAVLKRVAVPDKDALAEMRTEVDTLKKLKGQRYIVTYIDSHVSPLKGGGFEVFLLMEHCNGGGLIDLMNTRLQNRLTEVEILTIISDIALGVACMHYASPPLLHRDLKVENILIKKSGSSTRFKLCDFGSTSTPKPAAKNAREGRLIEEDIQKHTTIQYRSPEMIDVYRKQPINEKSDIWALGVLLYKLCYYTTPFEDQGQMAILNASFKFPAYPKFSDNLKSLIAHSLREDQNLRPNIYEFIADIARLRRTDVPIKNIYTSNGEHKRRSLLISSNSSKSPTNAVSIVGATRIEKSKTEEKLPDIVPMRRGRPAKPTHQNATQRLESATSSGSPFPPSFGLSQSHSVDEVSAKFPTIDDFSLFHDQGAKFNFGANSDLSPKNNDISRRVTNALADDAFIQVLPLSPPTKAALGAPSTEKHERSNLSDANKNSSQASETLQDSRFARISGSTIVTGKSQTLTACKDDFARPQIFRVPSQKSDGQDSPFIRESRKPSQEMRDATTVLTTQNSLANSSTHHGGTPCTSSQDTKQAAPDIMYGSSSQIVIPIGLPRSKSLSSKTRPSSLQSPVPSILRKISRERPKSDIWREELDTPPRKYAAKPGEQDEGAKIASDVEFLKAMEDTDNMRRREKRLSSGSRQLRKATMPSVSLTGTKQLLVGRFGEAFRKFENNNAVSEESQQLSSDADFRMLSSITGSVAADEKGGTDGALRAEEEEVALSPELRRELERSRLLDEERRVEAGAAEYKRQLAQAVKDGTKSSKKASSIQHKVRTLLDENDRSSSPVSKTATGYGLFTRETDKFSALTTSSQPSNPTTSSLTMPLGEGTSLNKHFAATGDPKLSLEARHDLVSTQSSLNLAKTKSAPTVTTTSERAGRNAAQGSPQILPKPRALRGGADTRPHTQVGNFMKPGASATFSEGTHSTDPVERAVYPSQETSDDWEAKFSQRYPDLAGLELVETEIDRKSSIAVGKMGQLDNIATIDRQDSRTSGMTVRDV